jgi:sensor histidine kinase YesM
MELSIEAHGENGSLILQVCDGGCGLGELEISGVFGRGLGLSNIRDRLAHLYGDRQQFSISNRPSGGAEVTVCVPLHTSAQISKASE